MKIEKIKITNYKVLQNFEIDFCDNEGEILDIIVIAGINGSGKTTILELIQDSFNSKFRFNNNDFINFSMKDFKKLIYFRVFDKQKEKVIFQIKNFIDMIKDNNEELTIREANQKATDDINSLFNGLDLKTKFKGISKDINREILFENDINNNIKLEELSSGEQQLFIRALSLKMMDLKNCVILIDEPETSLHPNWQNQILKIYQNISKDGNNQLIIATHSPQIISSTPNQSLRILIKDGKNIEVKNIDKSYGVEIEEVLQDLMGTKYLRTPKIAKDIKEMWNYLNIEDLENFEIIYNKLENILDLNDKDLLLSRLKKAKILSKR